MVDAEAQTEPPLPAAVVGVEQDVLLGARVRKSFGARAFWGSVVGCYWVSGGLFYKVSFDDGDVDIFSADEVLRDAQEAKNHAKESAADANKDGGAALDAYLEAMRHHSLKRKRDGVVDCSVPNVRRVQLWGQRLYASIYTNERNETFIKELLRAEDGGVGEMESTGHVQVGDMILAVNQTRALGLPSRELAELIKKPKRPITLTFYRPPQNRGETEQQAQGERGTLIAVTSFVPDEFGRPGEVEVSGKVLPGDVLVRVNSTYIRSGMTPGNVAEIVNATPRPMTLWFERASWDILDGKA
ncbi:TKL/TKL-CCIN protein kinase [Phytophthora cinnamomi]|uniref:TKL/TKL-CCIN protein kinase n=1 Tax=Phytophthora cinnamomi TaxID=4785 RepID=UPI00355998D3|nr:TKL/TKL-CCIN protein kinase [Phytophthora cinnamomi]